MRTYNISATKIPEMSRLSDYQDNIDINSEETKHEIVFENTIKKFNKTVGTIGSCTLISNPGKPKIVEPRTTNVSSISFKKIVKSSYSTATDSIYAKRMKFNIAPSTTITKINKPENSELNQESLNSEWLDNSK